MTPTDLLSYRMRAQLQLEEIEAKYLSRACRSEPLHSARLRDHGIMTCASIRRYSNVVKLAIEGGGDHEGVS